MKSNRTVRIVLGVLQLFVGISAIGGGAFLVVDPTGEAIGFSVDQLAGSPFHTFLIPGLFLAIVNGLGGVAGGIFTFARRRIAGVVGIALGGILMLWIVIQVIIIGLVAWLQPMIFGFGLIELVLAAILTFRHVTDS